MGVSGSSAVFCLLDASAVLRLRGGAGRCLVVVLFSSAAAGCLSSLSSSSSLSADGRIVDCITDYASHT